MKDIHGYDIFGADLAASMALGYVETYLLDASSGDADAPNTDTYKFRNCRAISCDFSGAVKIAYLNQSEEEVIEVKYLIGGVIYQIRNVVRLYRYYKTGLLGGSTGTAKSYNTSGDKITNAIKIHR